MRRPLCYRLAEFGGVSGFETASLLPFRQARGGFVAERQVSIRLFNLLLPRFGRIEPFYYTFQPTSSLLRAYRMPANKKAKNLPKVPLTSAPLEGFSKQNNITSTNNYYISPTLSPNTPTPPAPQWLAESMDAPLPH